MTTADWKALAEDLQETLQLATPPVAITFSDQRPDGVDAFDDPMAPPTPDGRSGRAPAGCVFWSKATDRTFSTVPEDHGNCSVGRLTHGMATLGDIGGNSDVAALLGSEWVDMDSVLKIPTVTTPPGAVTYGPLHETRVDPDVVLIRVNGYQMMVLGDAFPDLQVEGKPQCQIIALAKEQSKVAASIGCALSRVRTGMGPEEMTCAIPAQQLPDVVDRLRRAVAIDGVVAAYAAEDCRRFA
jgi:uncharacterized protein (DUF169 family)